MSYVFGDYCVDIQRYELWRCGVRIPLRPKVFQVFAYLLEQRHRVVSRHELLEHIWPQQSVGEETLTSCIKAARQAVGDSGRKQRVIQTVHGRGLRFVADVLVRNASPNATTAPWLPAEQVAAPQLSRLFVGHETERATLQQWYVSALQGQRHIGLITGAAGIGKTALVDQFVASLTGSGAVWIGRGQCLDQHGAGEAYLPVLEALGRLCRGAEGEHFLDLLQQYAPSCLAQLPTLLPIQERDALQRQVGEASQARILRELTETLELVSIERPFVLVLEDLHWSDRATLEWLVYVARRRDPARLLILATYRAPEAPLTTDPVCTATQEILIQGQSARLRVGALSVQEVAAYMTQRFGARLLATILTPGLYQCTHGNPLFLTTIVDDLISRGVLQKGVMGWELTRVVDMASLDLPEILQPFLAQSSAPSPSGVQNCVTARRALLTERHLA